MKLFRKDKLTVEQEMIQGCIAGKRAMQKMLYDLYAKKMMAVCIRYSKTSFEAEDIMQEAFIKVLSISEALKESVRLSFGFAGSW
ncbi:RNA polymerase sigma factor [Adhaeribacter aquaticus]|uniref:RNA polymerase sigma factor n=1 Tax=Adhaeribacter aquaticus TaxID=299567 RepID=UPI0003F9455A|nr:sigma factor [Adhaeribacter aquaticus]